MTDYGIDIRQGYRLGDGVDLFRLSEEVRAAVEPVHREIQIREIAQQAAMILDSADLNDTPRPASVIFDAFQAHNEHIGQILAGEHSCSTTRLSLAFGDDPETGTVYALADTHFTEYADALVNMNFGDYYPYWDEAEGGHRLFGIRSDDWEERGKIWSRVLRGADAGDPHTMLRLDIGAPFADMDLINDTDAVLAAMPPMDARINFALKSLQSTGFASPRELMVFMSSVPAKVEEIRSKLRPITLSDLSGVTM